MKTGKITTKMATRKTLVVWQRSRREGGMRMLYDGDRYRYSYKTCSGSRSKNQKKCGGGGEIIFSWMLIGIRFQTMLCRISYIVRRTMHGEALGKRKKKITGIDLCDAASPAFRRPERIRGIKKTGNEIIEIVSGTRMPSQFYR